MCDFILEKKIDHYNDTILKKIDNFFEHTYFWRFAKNRLFNLPFLQKYFGKTLIEYGIKEAIADGTLCPYYYHVVLVELTEEEMDEYRELSIKISRF